MLSPAPKERDCERCGAGYYQREDGEGPAIQRDSPGKPAESAPKTSRQFQQFGEGATEFFDRFPLPRAAGCNGDVAAGRREVQVAVGDLRQPKH